MLNRPLQCHRKKDKKEQTYPPPTPTRTPTWHQGYELGAAKTR